MRGAGFLAALLLATSAHAIPECSLDGQGDVQLCEKVYWRSRIAGALLPSYTLIVDGHGPDSALTWNLNFDIPDSFWEHYFTIGGAPAPDPTGTTAFRINLGVSAMWVPARGDVEARVAMRLRAISLVWPNSPALDPLHIWAGIGVFGGTRGFGPRLEIRTRVGHLAWGGLALVAGFEPDPFHGRYTGDFSLGFDAPWVWWW
jgi:hypothetical protein